MHESQPSTSGPVAIAERVKAAARALGFDAVGICDLRPVERQHLTDWLARGYAGSMRYMERQAPRRREPARIVAGACRAVVVLKNYFQQEPPDTATSGVAPDADIARPARVARYAWGEDYHLVLGEKLTELAETLVDLGASRASTRPYVDAGPVPERELAERAGLGWIAKNTMLIHQRLGSFTFIGSVLTDLPLAIDDPFTADHCGSCRRCLDACPTDAFPTSHSLDARRCISYLTIEQRGPLAEEEGRMIDDWLFGCDICQDVCPWNIKFSYVTDEPRFAARLPLARPELTSLARGDRGTFDEIYADTAFERSGPEGMARNAAQVLANHRRKR